MKKRMNVFIFVLISILLLSACGGGGGETEVSLDPEVIYRHCISCHGQDLAGRSAPSLQNLAEKYTAEEIVDIIQNGIGRMDPITRVTEEQAEVLAEWLLEQ
jgi:cytochrome c551